jgi:hypothetical protein
MVKDLEVIFRKGPGGHSVPNDAAGHAAMWKKKSLVLELPYWEVLKVRYSISVVHMMKNLCLRLSRRAQEDKRYTGSTAEPAACERTRQHASGE